MYKFIEKGTFEISGPDFDIKKDLWHILHHHLHVQIMLGRKASKPGQKAAAVGIPLGHHPRQWRNMLGTHLSIQIQPKWMQFCPYYPVSVNIFQFLWHYPIQINWNECFLAKISWETLLNILIKYPRKIYLLSFFQLFSMDTLLNINSLLSAGSI